MNEVWGFHVEHAESTRPRLRRIGAESGTRGLFTACLPRIVNASASCAIVITTHELGQSFFQTLKRNSLWARERNERIKGMRTQFLPWMGWGRRRQSQVPRPQRRDSFFLPLNPDPRGWAPLHWAYPGPPQTALFMPVLIPKPQVSSLSTPLPKFNAKSNDSPHPHFPVCVL